MSLTRCDKCRGDMDVFEAPPACLHQPPCAISFCWRDGRVWYRGACAREALEQNPPATTFTLFGPSPVEASPR